MASNGSPFHGAIPGEFAVSPTGAATYSIPIDVPPGIGGLQPALSLEYNSHSGNGLLGMGWSLGGLSAISRCPTTLAQDNFLDPVDFDSNDRLCLDGQRLVPVTNTGCGGGTEYRTEIDSHARVCAYGSQGSGPAWFRMWTKAGLVMDYGNSGDSRIEAQGRSDVLVWALNRLSDTAGNYLTVAYHEDNANGEYYPLRIEYAGNTNQGMAPFHSVQFLYEQRPDQSSGWIAGSVTRSRVRMTNVQAHAGFEVIRDYRLTYETSPMTARSRLSSLTLCSAAGYSSECLPAMTLDWSNGQASFDTPVNTGRNSTGHQYAQAIDINGDGKTDLAYCTSTSSTWQILISNGSGFNPPINSGILCTNYEYATPIDYDGDGRMDLLVAYANSRWYVLRSTGTNFSLVDTGIPSSGWNTKPVVADVNGNGRHDLILAHNSQWVIRINNGGSFGGPIYTGINNTNWAYRQVIDYDGDGMMDLLVPYANNRWYVLRSTGSGFQLIDTGLPNTGYDLFPQVLDVNGDGLQDLVVSHSGRLWLYQNKGNGFSSAIDANVHGYSAERAYQIDYDSDGRTDLLVLSARISLSCSGGLCTNKTSWDWHVFKSTGMGFTHISTGLTATERPDYPKIGDFNGDGHLDVAIAAGGTWHLQRHTSGVPDLISAVSDGVGNVTAIDYEPLTDNNLYLKGSVQAYPQFSIQSPLYVVSEVSVSNGIGGTNTQRYTYADARVDLRGRGFLGFRTVTALDDESQIRTLTTYNQTFPFVGLVTSVDIRHVSASAPIKKLTNAWSNVQPYGGVYQVRAGASTEWTYELNGALVTTVTTTPSQYDGYGNPGQLVSTTTGGGATYSKTTSNTYVNDAMQWRLGRLSRATATSSAPSGFEARTSAFEYDPATGLLAAEIIEPDDPQLTLRTEYGYDGYGNQSSVTVRDSGGNSYPITTTVSTTHYDYSQLTTNGTYTVTNANAKGHTESRIIDARFGKPSSLTGPNGLTTQWDYDSFGRQTRETRADGTQTVTDAVWCNSACAGTAHAVYKVTTQVTGSAPSVVYFDSLNREVRSEAVTLTGQAVYKDTQYNTLGQVSRLSRPYLVSSLPHWTEYQYDLLGRAWRETSPDGGIVETTYNGLTTIVRRYAVNDPYDQTVTQVMDAMGNLVRVIDEGYQSTHYEYDPFGNLTRVTDPAGNATVMTYDRRGRKLVMNEPNMGVWEYRYDALGQLRWQKDAKNQVVTMSYDVLGRMIQRVQPEGTSTWTYDTRSKGIGKLSQINGVGGYIERHYYDVYGRPRQVQKVVDGTTLTTTTAYDAQGRVSRLTYPSGFAVRYQYNTHGHLFRLVNHANTAEHYWTAQAANADGHVTQELLGNGLSTVRTFDPASGRLTYLGTFGAATNVQALSYQYDALGNLGSRENYLQGLSETFQYDAFNRLTQATIAGVGTKSWGYDGLGNITAKDGHTDYAYSNGRPHAVSYARGSSYGYDANGNMTSGAGRAITWNSDNKPTRIQRNASTVDFSYAPDGTRYKQASSVSIFTPTGNVTTVTTTLYAGSHHERVTVNGVTTHKDYLSAGGRVVAIRETANGTASMKYLHQDHLGSTDVITDASSQVVERMSFDAFGSRRDASNWNDPVAALVGQSSSRGFTGHEQLDGVGLIHMNGRVYDPELGRFLSADPYVGTPANPQNLNRYSYVNNNPLSYTDPSGYFVKKLFKGVKKLFDNKVFRAAVAIVGSAFTFGYVGLLTSSPFWGAVAGGFVGGSIATGTLKGGVIGAFTAGAFYGVGSLAQAHNWGTIRRTLAHGVVGGGSSAASGGRFQSGFMSAGFTQFASPVIGTAPGDVVGRTMVAAVVGGTASEIGGGKFANGAVTGAFSRLFNDESHSDEQQEKQVVRRTEQEFRRTVDFIENAPYDKWEFQSLGDLNELAALALGRNPIARMLSIDVQIGSRTFGQFRRYEIWQYERLYEVIDGRTTYTSPKLNPTYTGIDRWLPTGANKTTLTVPRACALGSCTFP
jgi:RHS repeat-associated protein